MYSSRFFFIKCLMVVGYMSIWLFPYKILGSSIDRFQMKNKKEIAWKCKELCPVIYPYLVNPCEYPEYYRRPFFAPSWKDFEYKTQFVVGRSVPSDVTNAIDVKGKVYRPNMSFMRKEHFVERLQFLAKNNLFLHNIGGFGPGIPKHGSSFGEHIISESQINQIKRYVGNRFTGFDIGEQDGRYNFTYSSIIEPYVPDRKYQYLVSQSYFERIARNQGNWCSALNVLWYWHQLIKEGSVILAGAETQNKVTNGQVQYMHLRGAGKQYGILWYGDVSVFSSWGSKKYNDQEFFKNANNGGSLSLMKRSYYTQYMYNSTILSMEQGWCIGPWAANKGELSPIGIMHNDCVDFVNKYGQPGVMVTQIALLNDFYSGWMPASHISSSFRVWNGMPYEAGDYLTDALINMFYPNYDRSGFFHDETGAMCATPFGENVDALLSDARVEVMNQYPVMVAAGDLFSGGKELSDKITAYVEQGGTFIVTAKNAARLWPKWGISELEKMLPAGTVVQIGDEKLIEDSSFKLYRSNLKSNVSVLARIEDIPVVVIKKMGEGRVILSLTEYGLNAEPYSVKTPPRWKKKEFDVYLERPYRLLNHFYAVLESVFSSVNLFSVGSDLGYIVNYLDSGKYRLAIYNNTLKSLPFKIESNIGKIKSIKELSTGRELFQSAGYWPSGIKGMVGGKNDSLHIYGGDIRLFDVEVENEYVKVKDKIVQPKPVTGSYIATDNMMYLKEDIRLIPTFFDYFNGVAIQGLSILQMDTNALLRHKEWYSLQSLDIAADLRNGFNSGYWTFDVRMNNFHRTKKDIMKIVENLRLLNSKCVLFIPSAFQQQCPDEWKTSYNICFIDSMDSTSNWAYGMDVKLLTPPKLDWNVIYNSMYRRDSLIQINDIVDRHTSLVNKNHILALDRYNDDIRKTISEIPYFFEAFGGVCITAEYIANKSLAALLVEKEWWDEVGISVIVSFIEEINHFPGLTLCDAVPVYYDKSLKYYKDVFDKMEALGMRVALFTTHRGLPMKRYKHDIHDEFKRTYLHLSEYVKNKSIKILITNTRFREMATVKQQQHMIDEIGNKNNLGLAINLNHLTENAYVKEIEQAGSLLGAVILGGVGSIDHSEYLPISQSKKSADYLNSLENVLLIEKNGKLNNRNIYDDCLYMKWISKKCGLNEVVL